MTCLLSSCLLSKGYCTVSGYAVFRVDIKFFIADTQFFVADISAFPTGEKARGRMKSYFERCIFFWLPFYLFSSLIFSRIRLQSAERLNFSIWCLCACLVVCGQLQNCPISKISLDFKKSRTKMCFSTFWSTFNSGSDWYEIATSWFHIQWTFLILTSLSISSFIYLAMYLCLHLSISPYIYPSISSSLYPSNSPSISHFISPSIYH